MPDKNEEIPLKSKSQVKREMDDSKILVEKLIELKAQRWSNTILLETFKKALADFPKHQSHIGKKRHMGYLVRLLNEHDLTIIQQEIKNNDIQGAYAQQKRQHMEQWREQLLQDLPLYLTQLMREYPQAEPRIIKQLVAKIQSEMANSATPASYKNTAYKKLFQYLKDLNANQSIHDP